MAASTGRVTKIINLYRLDPATQKLAKLTDVPYIFGWRWNEDATRVAFVPRLGHIDERLGEVRVLDLDTGEETVIMQDTPDMRFTWTGVSWQPQGKGVVVTALKDADRNQANLVYVDFEKKNWTVLTDPSKPRNWPEADHVWLSDDEFVYYSNEDGYTNAYRHNLKSGKTVQITSFTRDIGAASIVVVDGRKHLFAIIENPIENEMVLIDPANGKTVHSETVPLNMTILDNKDNRLMVSSTAATSKFQIDEITVTRKSFDMARKVDLPEGLKEKIVHSRVEKVDFPTFDKDEKTGKTRMLHAFLYHPENPLPKDHQLVMIKSFYGGENEYSRRNQILAEAGIYVLSPSPRGSRGLGREFSALNDKDLGGNEIVDVIYAARWISEKLGIPPSRIGVFGGSHGGYATMRCLTFPGEINGVKADFDWGFGLSHAGFSDIIQFYEHCNIPDWVILEAGDPETEADKLNDRSPIYHAVEGRGKLLLTHGTNDSRVPIAGSRAMADSLRSRGKDVTLVEFEGQGHGIKGLANTVRYYKTLFEFLVTIPTGDEHATN
jgi:dipeptidyl aminopeptidase/acylaminoacyl peptidase